MKFNAILFALAGAALAAPGAVTPSSSLAVTGTISTVYTFLPGNPPAPSSSAAAAAANNKKRAVNQDASITTSTIYPCATPFPSLTPTLPYGDASLPSNFDTENTLYELDSTTEGASAQACCNACFFDLPNCVQAYWYSYEGCVVSQATNASLAAFGSGQQVSTACPAGTFNDLVYSNDTNPAFDSTGNIAGPCGQTYNDI